MICDYFVHNHATSTDSVHFTLAVSTVDQVEYEIKHTLDPSGQQVKLRPPLSVRGYCVYQAIREASLLQVLEEPLVLLKLTISDPQPQQTTDGRPRQLDVTLTARKFQLLLHGSLYSHLHLRTPAGICRHQQAPIHMQTPMDPCRHPWTRADTCTDICLTVPSNHSTSSPFVNCKAVGDFCLL